MEYPAEGTFPLPGGLVLERGGRLGEAELRPLTGREEEWLAWHPAAPSATAVSRLLSSCLVRLDDVPASGELARNLLVGDRDYLILQLRRMTLGATIPVVFDCPACSAPMDVDLDIDSIPVDKRPQSVAGYSLTLGGETGSSRTVRFRLPTGADQEAILGLDLENAARALMGHCLLDDGGSPLSPDEETAVVDAMEQLAPQVNLELELICPECAHSFVAPFDTTAFFFQEMRVQREALLHEVHWLAFYYHWSESNILALTRERRRTYLALLNETVRPE